MKKNRMDFMICLLFFSSLMPTYASPLTRENREIVLAEKAIFWSLVAAASKVNQRACSDNPFACSDDRADLGLALLGAKGSYGATVALNELLRYRLDAGISESFSCHVLTKRRASSIIMSTLRPEALRERCVHEFEQAAKDQPDIFNGVPLEAVCAKKSAIELRRRELQTQLAEKRKCHPGDF